MKVKMLPTIGVIICSTLFCSTAMAVPPMPADLQMAEPDPLLPKELRDFVGKWQGTYTASIPGMSLRLEFFIIIEKIGEKNANLDFWQTGMSDWKRDIAEVIKDENKLQFMGKSGINELTLDKFGRMVLHVAGVKGPSFGGITYLKRVP